MCEIMFGYMTYTGSEVPWSSLTVEQRIDLQLDLVPQATRMYVQVRYMLSHDGFTDAITCQDIKNSRKRKGNSVNSSVTNSHSLGILVPEISEKTRQFFFENGGAQEFRHKFIANIYEFHFTPLSTLERISTEDINGMLHLHPSDLDYIFLRTGHLERHKYFLSEQTNREVSMRDAMLSWYAQGYAQKFDRLYAMRVAKPLIENADLPPPPIVAFDSNLSTTLDTTLVGCQ